NSGAYVDDVVYSAGSETYEGFALVAGEKYTFIAFSIGSTATVPAVDTTQTLSTATLTNISGDQNFMWYTKTMTLTPGVNNLDVVLKHQFSQITTVVDVSVIPDVTTPTGIANITAVSANIVPYNPTATIKLSDRTITYSGGSSFKPVVFPAL